MDILSILEELEDIVDRGAKIPMTGKVLVDDEAILELIDKVRAALPEELNQAKWVTKERERILEDARAESDKLVEQGRTYLSKLVEESEVVRLAQEQAEEIVGQAKQVAGEIRNGARAYADDVLGKIEGSLLNVADRLKRDREELARTAPDNRE
ncbi:MAG TPA: ATPase [Desulfobacteria bacterium]|nr:ATPase [Desulfobacteria bacterium]